MGASCGSGANLLFGKNKHIAAGVIVVAAALFAAVYVEAFLEEVYPGGPSLLEALLTDLFSWPVFRLVLLFVIFLVAFCALTKAHRILHWIFVYRFALAIATLILLVIFQISGSSISLWAEYLGDASGGGLLFGLARAVRSDEWLVFTPFALSQSYTGYAEVSDLIRGGDTNVTMVYGQPAWALATLFRPFLWGYMLLGSSYGLSFFWCGRLIALFLVTFECARLYTHDNRRLCAVIAVLVTFSPIVQWWFAVNGTAELLIFGQLLVMSLGVFLRGGKSSLAAAALMPWFAGCYLFVIYPSWQVPFFYVFAAMGVWQVIDWRKDKLSGLRNPVPRYSIIALVISLVAVIAFVATSLYQARDVIASVMGTVYPGERCETGGGLLGLYFNYGLSIISAVDDMDVNSNVCEFAAFYSLAPAGMFLAVYAFVAKKRDSLLGALLVVQALFLIYGFFGLPEAVCKVLLLSNAQTERLVMAIGFVDIVLLFRAICVLRESPGRNGVVLPIALAGVGVGLCGCLANQNVSPNFAEIGLMALGFILMSAAVVSCLRARQCGDALLLMAVVAVVGVSGLCVNPVQQGTNFLDDTSRLKMIQQVSDEYGEGVWLSDGSKDGQSVILAGASSINSVNVYPNLSLWSAVDPDGEYADVYNRYAHIRTMVQDESETYFELEGPDVFKAVVNVEDLEKLGVDYLLTVRDYSGLTSSSVSLDLLVENGGYRIYRVVEL